MIKSFPLTSVLSTQVLKWIITGIIFVALCLFLSTIDISRILSELKSVGIYIICIIPLSGIGYFFGTLAWKYCLSAHTKGLSFMDLFMIRQAGESLALINPTSIIAGDGSKSYILVKKGIDSKDALTSVIISRFLLIASAVILFILAAIYLFFFHGKHTQEGWVLLTFFVPTSLLLIIIYTIITSRKLILSKIFSKIAHLCKHNKRVSAFAKKVLNLNVSLVNFNLNNRKQLVVAFIFSCLHWMVGGIEVTYILYLLGNPISIIDGMAIEMGIAFLKSLASFVPGQIGVEEYANKTMLSIIGLSSVSLWISVSILRRFRQLIWILIGMVFLPLIKK